jgi:MFS family permease
MVPLDLFRSRTFSGVNVLTLFLYAALGGALFFLPFNLIQVHGYSATVAGSVFLPFTIVMAMLSRVSGGLLDRFGPRPPLMVGPLIVALGFWLLAFPTGSAFWSMFLLPMTVIGLGMAISVAPLTTLVINAVDTQRAGVASGINNAVAALATLLAVAVFGAVALGIFDRELDRLATESDAALAIRAALERARGHFVSTAALADLAGENRRIAEFILRQALAQAIQVAMLLAAGLALAAAAIAATTIRADDEGPPQGAAAHGKS